MLPTVQKGINAHSDKYRHITPLCRSSRVEIGEVDNARSHRSFFHFSETVGTAPKGKGRFIACRRLLRKATRRQEKCAERRPDADATELERQGKVKDPMFSTGATHNSPSRQEGPTGYRLDVPVGS